MSAEVIILGAGIFGLSSAIHLNQLGYSVTILDQGDIPYPLSASDDISKAVRVEYGSDELYFRMAEDSIEMWKEWNEILGESIYHEVGYTMLSPQAISKDSQPYEHDSLSLLRKHGYEIESLNRDEIVSRFPAFRKDAFAQAIYNPKGGYVESGKAIQLLSAHFSSEINVRSHSQVTSLIVAHDKVMGVELHDGERIHADLVVVAAGAYSASLVPELQNKYRVSGHPLFWFKPDDIESYAAPHLSVYAADISHSGWYGFPYHPAAQVVKIGWHATGTSHDPHDPVREVTGRENEKLTDFIQRTFHDLSMDDLIHAKKCLYTDTHDGDYLICLHPGLENCIIATGGSGHGMKLGPMIGRVVCDVLLSIDNDYTQRFAWREMGEQSREAARSVE